MEAYLTGSGAVAPGSETILVNLDHVQKAEPWAFPDRSGGPVEAGFLLCDRDGQPFAFSTEFPVPSRARARIDAALSAQLEEAEEISAAEATKPAEPGEPVRFCPRHRPGPKD